MTEPVYENATERLYAALPEMYRILDSQNDYQMKTYISAIADQLNEIEVLQARLEYIGPEDRADFYAAEDEYNVYERPAGLEDPALGWSPIAETSDLFDSRTADTAWLTYIAQVIGVPAENFMTELDLRKALAGTYAGYSAGSRKALEDATRSIVIDGVPVDIEYVRVYPHFDTSLAFSSIWDILIVTKASETPDGIDIPGILEAGGIKPAGVVLYHVEYSVTWGVIEISFGTWTNIEAFGSWDNLELGNPDLLPE